MRFLAEGEDSRARLAFSHEHALPLLENLPDIDIMGLTKIEERILSSASPSVTFSAIPSTYRHLLMVWSAMGSANGSGTLQVQFNGDTSAIYDESYLRIIGSTITATPLAGQNQMGVGSVVGTDANRVSAGRFEVFDYARTFDQKTVIGHHAATYGATTADFEQGHWTGWWRSTAAITSILIKQSAGSFPNFGVGSMFTLYGLAA